MRDMASNKYKIPELISYSFYVNNSNVYKSRLDDIFGESFLYKKYLRLRVSSLNSWKNSFYRVLNW